MRSHKRLLFSGVRVGLESPRADTCSSKEKVHSTETLSAHSMETISAQHSSFRTATDSSFTTVTDSSTNITPVCVRDPTVAEGKRVDTQLNPTVVEGKRVDTQLDPQIASKNLTDWRIKDIIELIDSSTANPSSQEGLLQVCQSNQVIACVCILS
jgi:hypothetical protein